MDYQTYQNVLRPQQGLVITLASDKKRKTQIVLDTVHRRNQLDGPVTWEHKHMCTVLEYETNLLVEMLQNQEEMAKLGKSILGELLHQSGRFGSLLEKK